MPNPTMPRHWAAQDGDVASSPDTPIGDAAVCVTINALDPAQACLGLFHVIRAIFNAHVYDPDILAKADIIRDIQRIAITPSRPFARDCDDETPF